MSDVTLKCRLMSSAPQATKNSVTWGAKYSAGTNHDQGDCETPGALAADLPVGDCHLLERHVGLRVRAGITLNALLKLPRQPDKVGETAD